MKIKQVLILGLLFLWNITAAQKNEISKDDLIYIKRAINEYKSALNSGKMDKVKNFLFVYTGRHYNMKVLNDLDFNAASHVTLSAYANYIFKDTEKKYTFSCDSNLLIDTDNNFISVTTDREVKINGKTKNIIPVTFIFRKNRNDLTLVQIRHGIFDNTLTPTDKLLYWSNVYISPTILGFNKLNAGTIGITPIDFYVSGFHGNISLRFLPYLFRGTELSARLGVLFHQEKSIKIDPNANIPVSTTPTANLIHQLAITNAGISFSIFPVNYIKIDTRINPFITIGYSYLKTSLSVESNEPNDLVSERNLIVETNYGNIILSSGFNFKFGENQRLFLRTCAGIHIFEYNNPLLDMNTSIRFINVGLGYFIAP